MASFGDVDLELSRGSGAVFAITPSFDDRGFNYPSGLDGDVAMPAASHSVIVRGLAESDFTSTLAAAREAANRAIDVAFSQGRHPVSLKHRDSTYAVWWPDASGTTLRIVATCLTTSRLSATVEVRDSEGRLVVATPPPPQPWHESLRYYRVSESSQDLYDSFRNVYLALEAILSSMVPPKVTSTGAPEREGAWLRRALRTIAADLDLGPYAPLGGDRSAPNAIFDELYQALRTAIFHAKTGRDVWLPQDWAPRTVITEARVRYSNLYRKLAEHHLGVRYPGSGFTTTLWQEMVEHTYKTSVVYVSDDTTPVTAESPGEDDIAPAGGRVIELAPERADGMNGDRRWAISGTASAQEIHNQIGSIRRLGVLREGHLAIVESLPAPLSVHGAHRVEVVFLVEGRNHGAPRQDFSS